MIEQSANANVAVLALDLPVKVPAQGRIIDEAIPRLLREPGVTVHRAGGTEHKVQRLTLHVVSDLFEAGGARRVLQYLIDRDGRGGSRRFAIFVALRDCIKANHAQDEKNEQKDIGKGVTLRNDHL